MEKLPLMIHGMSITDQAATSNVGPEHRLPFTARLRRNKVSGVFPHIDNARWAFGKLMLSP